MTQTNDTYYAIRLGFGSEGHGDAIFVAKGDTADECEANADSVLQGQFGGLWTSKKTDTYIGRRAYLNREFPEQPGRTTVDEAIDSADAPVFDPQTRYIGSRNAASGKAEAVMVRVYRNGTIESLDKDSIDQSVPTFSEAYEAIQWAKKTFICQ